MKSFSELKMKCFDMNNLEANMIHRIEMRMNCITFFNSISQQPNDTFYTSKQIAKRFSILFHSFFYNDLAQCLI